MGGRNMMHLIRLLLYASLCTIIFAFPGQAQITSWTDANGVRHFSNVNVSGEHKAVKKINEYKTEPSDEETDQKRDRFQILQMYKEDRENEEKQKAVEKHVKAAEEKERELQAAAEKAEREKRKACTEHKRNLEDLQHLNWEDYDAPEVKPAYCPDKRWRGSHGRMFDNMEECTERRNKSLKSAYEEAIRQQEEEVKKLCPQ
jgi:hypothetical protein